MSRRIGWMALCTLLAACGAEADSQEAAGGTGGSNLPGSGGTGGDPGTGGTGGDPGTGGTGGTGGSWQVTRTDKLFGGVACDQFRCIASATDEIGSTPFFLDPWTLEGTAYEPAADEIGPTYSLVALADGELIAAGGAFYLGAILETDEAGVLRRTWSTGGETSSPLTSLNLDAQGRAVSISSSGRVIRGRGADWEVITPPVPEPLGAGWAGKDGSIVAAGSSGLYTFDGSTWTLAHAFPEPLDLFSLWGDGEGFLVGVGPEGAIAVVDGSAVHVEKLGGGVLWSVEGTSRNDVWAVGDDGRVLHFDGEAWTTVDTGASQGLVDVTLRSPGDPVIVGYAGEVVQRAP